MIKKIIVVAISVLSMAGAAENFYPNSGFEKWNQENNLPVCESGQWNIDKFSLLEQSDKEVYSGKYSLHLKDDDAGKSNSTFAFSAFGPLQRKLAGKVVAFSAKVKVISASPEAQVGLRVWCRDEDGKNFYYQQNFDKSKISEWQKLTVKFRVPQNVKLLRFTFNCSNGFYNTGEAYFDDAEIVIVPDAAPGNASPPEIPQAALIEAPGVLSPEAIVCRQEYEKAVVYENDGYVRPKISNGTWEINGKSEFMLGGWLYRASTSFTRDWPVKKPNPQGIDHFAYNERPSKELFDKIGFNSSQVYGEMMPGALLFGLKKLRNCAQGEEYIREYYQSFKDVPLTMEMSFGFNNELRREMPELGNELKQSYQAWHNFIPFCPEDPRGVRYYECYLRGSVVAALKNRANIYSYELFNESVYGCQCVYNRKQFAEEMQKKYKTVQNANAVWDTVFGSFAELAAVQPLEQYHKLWPEWCEFSAGRYAAVLKQFAGFIRTIDKREDVFFTEQTHNINLYKHYGAGMDYRLIAEALDFLSIEGGWRYGDFSVGKARDGMEEIVLGANSGYSFVADLFSVLSKGKKPVANHEHYCGRFENKQRVPSRKADIISSLWNEIMHGISTVYVYCWDKRSHQWKDLASAKVNALDVGYKGFSYLNPYNWPPSELDGFQIFRNELELVKDKVLPFPRFKEPTVAIFYSYPTLRMDGMAKLEKTGGFQNKMIGWHNALKNAHYPVTFVFEEDLEKGLPENIQALVLPSATYAANGTVPAVERFIKRGGLVIADIKALKHDERGKAIVGLQGKHIRLNAETASAARELVQTLEINNVKRYIDLDKSFPQCDMQLIDRGDFKLIFLLNWSEQALTRAGKLKVMLDDSGEFYLIDPVNKCLLANVNKDTWNMSELRLGITVPVPPQQRALFFLQREKPVDFELNKVSPAQIIGLLEQINRQEAPEAERLGNLAAQAEIQYAADRCYDDVKITDCRPVDLSGFANMGFKDEVADDRKGGWFDQGINDFANMPLGRQVLCGVPFSIIDPARNNGKSALLLYGKARDYFPKAFKNIPVNMKAAKLYFLHTSAWTAENNVLALRYEVKYHDGITVDIPIRSGSEITDWHGNRVPANARIALETKSPGGAAGVINLQCLCWINPYPDKEIVSLSIISGESRTVTAIVAITVEIISDNIEN